MVGRNRLDRLLIATTALGLAGVALGLLAFRDPVFALSHNPAGIPRWLPHAVAVALAAAGCITWRPRLDAGLLAAWWALAGAAFSAPGLRHLGLPTAAWAGLLPIGAGLLIKAVGPSTSPRSRLAIVAALAPSVAVVLVLALPYPSGAARFADAAVYTLILTAAGISAWLGLYLRSLR